MWGVSHRNWDEEPKPEARRSKSGGLELLGGGNEPPSPGGNLGDRCKLPTGSAQRHSPGKFEIRCKLRPQKSLQNCLIMCTQVIPDGDPAIEGVLAGA